jgi:hypothetical protein
MTLQAVRKFTIGDHMPGSPLLSPESALGRRSNRSIALVRFPNLEGSYILPRVVRDRGPIHT